MGWQRDCCEATRVRNFSHSTLAVPPLPAAWAAAPAARKHMQARPRSCPLGAKPHAATALQAHARARACIVCSHACTHAHPAHTRTPHAHTPYPTHTHSQSCVRFQCLQSGGPPGRAANLAALSAGLTLATRSSLLLRTRGKLVLVPKASPFCLCNDHTSNRGVNTTAHATQGPVRVASTGHGRATALGRGWPAACEQQYNQR